MTYYAEYIRLIKVHLKLHNKQHTNSFIKNNIPTSIVSKTFTASPGKPYKHNLFLEKS